METLWTTSQVAQYFGVSDQTIGGWRNRGILVGKRVGQRLYYDPAAVKSVGYEETGGLTRAEYEEDDYTEYSIETVETDDEIKDLD